MARELRDVIAKRARSMSPDGREYTKEMEDELNRLAYLVFHDEPGQKFLAYLKGITINTTFDDQIDPTRLMHFEGRRWLVGLIVKRLALGEDL